MMSERALLDRLGIETTYAGDDPWSEYGRLRDRIKAAVEVLCPGGAARIGAMTGLGARMFVQELTGEDIPNAELYAAMTHMAEAAERAVARRATT